MVPGLMRGHHRFLLREQLETIDHLSERIRKLDARIEAVTRPFASAIELLESMPGVARLAAEAILAETGDDMSRFPTAGHFASWAQGFVPVIQRAVVASFRPRRGPRRLRERRPQPSVALPRRRRSSLPGALVVAGADPGAGRRKPSWRSSTR